MSYEYNEKAHYAAHGKNEELITGKDLTQLSIVVRDDNENSESFSLKVVSHSLSSHASYQHNDWSCWIMNSSHGFTKYGLEKISKSILRSLD